MKVSFADMTARHCLFLVLTCHVFLAESRITRSTVKDAEHYCLIDPNHTMCQFQYDDQVSSKCIDVGDNDLTEQEIQLIVDLHNRYRDDVASGKELRGNLGPQPTAKHMMELVWDDELAYIARRWALQCNLGEKDRSRDVERFAVWQNVDFFYIDGVGNGTTARTLRDHIQRWYDQVESFDASKVGMVELADERKLTSYIAFASATITYVGCGRAIYTVDTNETAGSEDGEEAAAVGHSEFTRRLVDVLVCNYGPVDRTQPQQLYETGQPGSCPPGTKSSADYSFLCRKFEEPFELRKTHRARANPEKRMEPSSGAVARFYAQQCLLAETLVFFLPCCLLLLLRILSM